jgi:hypothetical protein
VPLSWCWRMDAASCSSVLGSTRRATRAFRALEEDAEGGDRQS